MPKAYAPASTAETCKPAPATAPAMAQRAPILIEDEPALIDRSVQGLAQRKLAGAMARRPGALGQNAFGQIIRDGAAAIAQRKGIDRLFGGAGQLRGMAPEESEAAQRDSLGSAVAPRKGARNPPAPALGANNTGLPDALKAGVESLSGLSLDHVQVHYNSSQPAQLNAHAYAQGSEIHVAPGQEHHLPHEAWHVVQQAQGRVRPTSKLADGMPVNEEPALEREADQMGGQAMNFSSPNVGLASAVGFNGFNIIPSVGIKIGRSLPVQRWFKKKAGDEVKDQMNQIELDAELAKFPSLSPGLILAIRARFRHDIGYIFANTIMSAKSGRLKPVGASAAVLASARETAGYVNPPHFHNSVIDIHRAAAVSPQPAGRDDRAWLKSPTRRFYIHTPTHTSRPKIAIGHSETVLGHHYGKGAVDMWNKHGHKHTRRQNLQHNQNKNRFHGLEGKKASARSGGNTKERYRVPTPTSSHISHLDPTHSEFYARNHWNGVSVLPGVSNAVGSAGSQILNVPMMGAGLGPALSHHQAPSAASGPATPAGFYAPPLLLTPHPATVSAGVHAVGGIQAPHLPTLAHSVGSAFGSYSAPAAIAMSHAAIQVTPSVRHSAAIDISDDEDNEVMTINQSANDSHAMQD